MWDFYNLSKRPGLNREKTSSGVIKTKVDLHFLSVSKCVRSKLILIGRAVVPIRLVMSSLLSQIWNGFKGKDNL